MVNYSKLRKSNFAGNEEGMENANGKEAFQLDFPTVFKDKRAEFAKHEKRLGLGAAAAARGGGWATEREMENAAGTAGAGGILRE